jgi:hypothetical protein
MCTCEEIAHRLLGVVKQEPIEEEKEEDIYLERFGHII